MRRLLRLEALLNTDQEILGAFSGNLKSRRDDLEWFDLIHIFSRGPIIDRANTASRYEHAQNITLPPLPGCGLPVWRGRVQYLQHAERLQYHDRAEGR